MSFPPVLCLENHFSLMRRTLQTTKDPQKTFQNETECPPGKQAGAEISGEIPGSKPSGQRGHKIAIRKLAATNRVPK